MIPTFMGINTVTLGLGAAQVSLNTTGHNITNASTPGYSRQTANLATTPSISLYGGGGALQVGTGVKTQSVTRARDALIDMQYRQQNATQNFWQNQSDNYGLIENIFYDGTVGTQTVGLQASISNFWTSLQTLAAKPTNVGARTSVREMGNALVKTLKQDSDHLKSMAEDLTKQISSQVNDINNIAQQIAVLNTKISAQESNGSIANDLRDLRDLKVDQLSKLANVQVFEGSSGNYQVTVGGVAVVQGDRTYALKVEEGQNTKYSITTSTVKLEAPPNTPVQFTSGTLASMIQMRDETITGKLDELDTIAQFLLQTFNDQHKQGLDNNRNNGKNFFGDDAVNYNPTPPATHTPATCWLDELKVNDTLYTPAGLDLIAASAKTSADKDEGSNATLLSNLLNKDTSAILGSNTLLEYYGKMTGTLGVQSQQATNQASSESQLLASTNNWREAISGVNMDEEMSNMIKFQKAYQAAANVLSTMNSMLDTLINRTA